MAAPVSAQVVGNAFVNQYYKILHHSPELVHRFYQEVSKLGRPDGDGPLSLTTTMQAINEKILSLDYGEFKAEIKSVDAQESYGGGVHVLVTGCLEGDDNMIQNFTQTFFLAPQEKGYFVLNDMFQYVGKKFEKGNPTPVKDVEASFTPQQEDSSVQENHVDEQSMNRFDVNVEKEVETAGKRPRISYSTITVVEQVSVVDEVVPVPEVVDEPPVPEVVDEEPPVPEVVDEEPPVPEVVNEVPDSAQVEIESNSKTEEMPKKSYASIVMVMKENPMPISSPPRKPAAKSLEQVSLVHLTVSATVTPAAGFEVAENGNHQEGEGIPSFLNATADGFSIYIKGLPMNATPAQLEVEFKKYGPIKYDGIQVRSNKQQGFCYGFVEFEEACSVDKAMEASPVVIGGRQAYVEEKKSTNTRASHQGRYSSGRGPGFRNEGSRGGRGNFGNGRGYINHRSDFNDGEFNGRSNFGNRGNSRAFSNRGGGFQSTGGRSNQGGGAIVKPVSATA